MKHCHPASTRGFTLVECMVAMAIGLLLLSGAFELFAVSRCLFTLQHEVARAQEGGRVALSVMAHTTRQAGFSRDAQRSSDGLAALFHSGAPRVAGTEGGKEPDTLTVRYQGHEDGSMLDCLGNPVTCMGNAQCAANPAIGSLVVTNRFFLTPASPDSGLRSLSCTRSIPAANPPKTDTQPLAEGVSDLQVTYGLDTDGDMAANRYADARQVEAAGGWARVVSVRLLVTTQGSNLKGSGVRAPALQRYERTVSLRNPVGGP